MQRRVAGSPVNMSSNRVLPTVHKICYKVTRNISNCIDIIKNKIKILAVLVLFVILSY